MSVNADTQPKGTDSVDQDVITSTNDEILEVEAEMSAVMTENPNLLGGEDVMELLERLTSADTMAQGMESKIDSVLENLDSLLALLGPSVNETDVEAADSDTVRGSRQDDTPLPDTDTHG
ncbi:hypothetical protein GALMADRAFT_234524 [Galerina marginata CBS 339.88]|uniref:Uncharacterized protein n=1 Tax=Galerina marginata (strain CBS 339.88) TaxID=685588 RepID=A0A067TTD1_GALM3|nr:hypothetical protein GALMADRAFT_234524 [Galerina marginata CBS 339.88]